MSVHTRFLFAEQPGDLCQSNRAAGIRQLIEQAKCRLHRLQAVSGLAAPRARRAGLRPGFHRGIIDETEFLQSKQIAGFFSYQEISVFLKNCWYVAALKQELID